MKLTIKHLAGYLPYGLLGISPSGNTFRLGINSNMLGKGIETRSIETFLEDQYKPLLRSLSQLTQEIEHDGVRFVPYGYFYDDPENDWFDGNVWLNYMFEGNTDKTDINFIPFYIVEKLQEWHFAIDIPSELYIEMEAIPTTKPNTA